MTNDTLEKSNEKIVIGTTDKNDRVRNIMDLSSKNQYTNSVGDSSRFSGFSTLAIRSGYTASSHREHSEAIYETSSYTYSNCEESYRKFSGLDEGNVYSRFTNPTVRTFEKKLSLLEFADDAIACSSGMSAILTVFCGLLSAGDKLVCSSNVFGSTRFLINNFFIKFNVIVSYVDLTDYNAWERESKDSRTKMMFLETPANPTLEVADLLRLENITADSDIILVVDNTVCTPASQNPILMGADLVVHSTSKYIDGQGRCIGGAVAGKKELIDLCRVFMRCAGPSMTAHNAWVFSKGLETLELRVEKHSYNALKLAQWLETHPRVERVLYPGLESHPHHAIAKRQQRYFGGLVSFIVKGTREEVWSCIDKANLCSLTTNIGDTKTIITHPASTTHVKLTKEEREAVGIVEGLVRVSTGLEYIGDIIDDINMCLS